MKAYLFGRHRLLTCLSKFLDRLLIISQILLATDQNDRQALAEMKDLRDPLQSSLISILINSIGRRTWSEGLPSLERCPRNPGSRWQSRSR